MGEHKKEMKPIFDLTREQAVEIKDWRCNRGYKYSYIANRATRIWPEITQQFEKDTRSYSVWGLVFCQDAAG